MACYSPFYAYKIHGESTLNGKSLLVFSKKSTVGKTYTEIQLPCGQCVGCRLDQSMKWAVRCYHESQMWNDNCYLTLTYDDDNMPAYGSLNRGQKSDFTRFMKRLRKVNRGTDPDEKGNYPIRYFQCGEYGDQLKRPHHHACMFNYEPKDREYYGLSKSGYMVYESKELDRIWSHGKVFVQDFTVETAAYVARYTMKKVTGKGATEHYWRFESDTNRLVELEQEYVTMSRRPGLGQNWHKKYGDTDVQKDFITIDGKKYKIPKYYDELRDQKELELLKYQRRVKALPHRENNTTERLRVRRKCHEKRAEKLVRGL